MSLILDRWGRVQDLCEAVDGMEPHDAEAYLARSEPDAGIRSEALSLLGALRLEEAARARIQAEQENIVLALPTAIGPYRIVDVIGSGGFGRVYRAALDVDGVDQYVAIKVLRDVLAGDDQLERFRRERKLLRAMDNPRIARFLDSGVTPEGAPYLVMELVNGKRIDRHCDEQRLSVAARIELLIRVCDAVHQAHRRLIVHLDLKPSNVLVTPEDQVKLLDFGTAKLLSTAGDLTSTRQLTPDYASPERLRGDPVSVACDIYSLGLILHELVSGSWAFSSRNSIVSIAERASGTTEVRALSSAITPEAAKLRAGLTAERLKGLIGGDLQAICAKALAYRPSDRYLSMEAFADDLSRFLGKRPILARSQTALYRARKYVDRHRGGVFATLVFAIGILGATGQAWWQQQKRVQAGLEAQDAEALLTWAISSSNTLYGGRSGMTVRELVERANARLDYVNNLPAPVRVRLHSTFSAYLYQDGETALGKRIARQAAEIARPSGDAASRIGAGMNLATYATYRGDCKEALRQYAEIDPIYRSSERRLPVFFRVGYLVTRSEMKTSCENDPEGAHSLMSKVAPLMAQIPDDDLTVGMPPRILKAIVANHEAQDLRARREYDEAERIILQALKSAQEEKESGNARVALLRTLSLVRYDRGRGTNPADLQAAARALEEAMRIAPGFMSPYETIRLKVLWGTSLAQAAERRRGVAIIVEAIAEARQREKDLARQGWMIDVAAAYGLAVWARDCSAVPEALRHAEANSGGSMPPGWRWQFLAASGVCRIEAGEREAGAALVREGIQAGGLPPDHPARQALENILDRAR